MRAAGVGNWDEIVRVGEWNVGRKPPLALGVEAPGVVSTVGEDVTSFAPGDEVLTHPLPLRHQGAWAQLLVAPAALVASRPLLPPAGEWVVAHGAGGVTGGLIVQLALVQQASTRPASARGRIQRAFRAVGKSVESFHATPEPSPAR